jgi:hypothetical protein
MTAAPLLAANSGTSAIVNCCQICGSSDLKSVLFLGYLPPVNQMSVIGTPPHEQPSYPADLLCCQNCKLVQLGLVVDKKILFPAEYPYTSGTTQILCENFSDMYRECQLLYPIANTDLVVDIGSNDGTLLSNFKAGGHRVCGIEPTDMGKLARERGIPTLIRFFDESAARQVIEIDGKAKVITAANVFAHIEDIHAIVKSILLLLDDHGIFISESHYLLSLLETLQYDTVYHEHLRYYSLQSLRHLFEMHGLEIIHAKKISTHGGSIRIYASRKGRYPTQLSVKELFEAESTEEINDQRLKEFKGRVLTSKLSLMALLRDIKKNGGNIFAVGAPSRASTLISYTGLDDGILDCVVEVQGSHKIGKYMPGTLIPVLEESQLFEDQPEYAMLTSWHIAEELIPKLKSKGFRGKFIVPLPIPRIIE